MGNAKSLRGGTLVMTPLKGADGRSTPSPRATWWWRRRRLGRRLQGDRQPSVGRPHRRRRHGRARVPTPVGEGEFVHLELNAPPISAPPSAWSRPSTAGAAGYRPPVDGRRIRVRAPPIRTSASPSSAASRTRRDAGSRGGQGDRQRRTGSVVMNQAVALDTCAVAHGNLSVTVSAEPQVSQPAPLSGGQTVVTERNPDRHQQEGGSLINVKAGANLSDVVKALNASAPTRRISSPSCRR
jgi:flagellar P-ring protein precursor FlgI